MGSDTKQRIAADAELLARLGFHREDLDPLLRSGVSYEDARYLIRDLGCPPSLAADILCWASEVEASRP